MRRITEPNLFTTLSIASIALLMVSIPVMALDDDDNLWPDLRDEVFGENRTVIEEDGTISMEVPYRAEDAAVMPLTVRIPASIAPKVKSLTLLIDKNPMPVVATFNYGPGAGIGDRVLRTRVRVNMYSNVRAVIETIDGKLHMTTKFVKAAGGCSAAAMKDADEAMASIGKMKIRSFRPENPQSKPASREAQVMIRHPNYSGMQMNQLTGLYIPAKYVEYIEVRQGDTLIFRMEGGISLSEDPNLRFTYSATATGPLTVTARDTDGRTFKTKVDAGT